MTRKPKGDWTVFSQHGLVLYEVAWNQDLTISEIARAVGLSESWVRRILTDLEDAGMVRVEKRGVQNHYTVVPSARLRHPVQRHITLGDLFRAVTPPAPNGPDRPDG